MPPPKSKGGKMLGLINWRLKVTINDGRALTGQMLAFDKHMNLVLAECEEFRRVRPKKKTGDESAPAEQELKRTLGLVILRGETVVSLSVEGPPPVVDEDKKNTMPVGPGRGMPAGRGMGMMPPSLSIYFITLISCSFFSYSSGCPGHESSSNALPSRDAWPTSWVPSARLPRKYAFPSSGLWWSSWLPAPSPVKQITADERPSSCLNKSVPFSPELYEFASRLCNYVDVNSAYPWYPPPAFRPSCAEEDLSAEFPLSVKVKGSISSYRSLDSRSGGILERLTLLCLPRTRLLRLALLPPSLILAYRAASSLDLSYGNDRLVYLNKGLVLAMTSLCFRAIIWAMSREPYKRLQAVNESASSKTKLFLDASDLAFGLRGIGWNWSRGLHIPQETRPLSSKMAFVSWTLLSLCVHIPLLDLMHYTVQSFGPNTFGTVKGGSIFDDDLPPITRYARSTFISFISGIVVYCAIRVSYDFSTIIGVLVLNQLPIQWPKVFDSPWKASSLSDFWAKRWHQLFRHFFIGIGSVPLYCAFGRVGSVLGAFLVSGLLHYVGLFGLGNGSDIMGMVGFFLLMGCGVLLEALWKKITGQRVGGWSGRIWTMVWLLGWSNLLVDAWARKGLIGALFIPDSQRLPVKLFGPLQTS